MVFILLELDEEKIINDDIVDLIKAKKFISDLFLDNKCFVFRQDGNANLWTRNVDYKDYETLWQIQLVFREEDWFRYYIKRWEYIESDDDMKHIEIREDIIKDWVQVRPPKP